MTTQHATARTKAHPAVRKVMALPLWREAENDNTEAPRADVLRDALKHFAKYGLSAAERAKELAQEAFFDGDQQRYKHWLDICRALDRRMAAAVEFRQRSGR